MFVNRLIEKIVKERLKISPAVAILGPRQCGKTTLSKRFTKQYFDLEKETHRTSLNIKWGNIIKRHNELIVLDEAQCFPEIFPKPPEDYKPKYQKEIWEKFVAILFKQTLESRFNDHRSVRRVVHVVPGNLGRSSSCFARA